MDREEINQDRIRRLAYELYEKRGSVNGSDLDDWLRAESELTPSNLVDNRSFLLSGCLGHQSGWSAAFWVLVELLGRLDVLATLRKDIATIVVPG